MPRIQAPTVAEHRAQQYRALVDSARSLLARTGQWPSMGQIAAEAGLARSSVYQYFASADELLTVIVSEVFPEWMDNIHRHIAAAIRPGEKVWAYIEANIDFFASPEHALEEALSQIVAPEVLHPPLMDFHRKLQVPMREALAGLGEPEPEVMADTIDSLIARTTHGVVGMNLEERMAHRDKSLRRLRRLLCGYLDIPAAE